MRKSLLVLTGALLVTGVIAMPTSAASTKTYHLFSKETSSRLYHNGQPVTDPDAAPVAGDTFVSTDNDYLGDHKKHSKRVYATDHVVCTFVTVDPATFTFKALCDAQIALPGGMLISDRQTISFGDKTVFGLTGGTGAFAKVKRGTVTSVSYDDDSDNSDLTVVVGT